MRPMTIGPSHGDRRGPGVTAQYSWRTEMKVLLVIVVIGSLGCDFLKDKSAAPSPTNIRCEQIGPPLPEIPADRKKRLDEIADLNSYIDLEIARHDKSGIDSVKMVIEASRQSVNKGATKDRAAKNYLDAINALDEAIDTAAKHRHR